ncbi:MAG: polysaccharide biosynthesis tyrosine autokinase [Acidobacteriota bacterium]
MAIEKKLLKHLERFEERGSSGILELQHPESDEKIFLYFYDGVLEAGSSNQPQYRLGQYIIREKLISEEELAEGLRRAAKLRKPLGEVLVERGFLNPGRLIQILNRQLIELVALAVEQGFTVGTFTGSTKGKMTFRLLMTSYQLTLELLRRQPLELVLAPTQMIELHDDGMKPAGWTPAEISIMTHLRWPQTVKGLVEETMLDEKTVLASLQVFLDLGLIRIIEKSPTEETALARLERLPLDLLVPRIRNPILTEKIVLINQEHSPATEQFRALKVRLLGQVDPPVKVLSVTSPGPADGKSLISANLAMNYAKEPGRRVLLIDTDLRGASAHEKLGISLGPGLHQYLLGALEPQCYLRRVGDFYVMTAGQLAENAVELLSLGRMRNLIEFAKREFDTVIVDAPPLLPIADARVVTGLTDASVLVIYQGQTPLRLIRKAMETIDRRKLLGVVLNGVKSTGVDGFYAYGYYYSSYSHHDEDVIELSAKPRKPPRRSRRSGSILFR